MFTGLFTMLLFMVRCTFLAVISRREMLMCLVLQVRPVLSILATLIKLQPLGQLSTTLIDLLLLIPKPTDLFIMLLLTVMSMFPVLQEQRALWTLATRTMHPGLLCRTL